MKSKIQTDIWLLVPVAILVTVSLATLLSINQNFFKAQLISLIIGIGAYIIFSRINIEFIKRFKLIIYGASLILLGIVLLIGIETRGANRWIELFGISIQFSEVLKPFLALSLAAVIEEYDVSFKSFLKIAFFILPIVLLITIQPDLGTGLLYAGAGMFTLLVIGFPILWFIILLLPFLIASPIIWGMLHGYQKQRVLTFINAQPDPLGTSYNGIQAIIAIGSGGFWGKGIAEGTQSVLKFLPERHTDFIFATISEGIGFVGALIVIAAFLLLLYRIYIIYSSSSGSFSRAFLVTCFSFIFIQGSVNIGMNMGLLPIVGITLPFVSFGGSSLLSNFIFLGMVSSISSKQTHKSVLEIK